MQNNKHKQTCKLQTQNATATADKKETRANSKQTFGFSKI